MRNTLLYIEKRLSVTQWQISRKEGCAGRKQGRVWVEAVESKREGWTDTKRETKRFFLLLFTHYVQLFVTS